jgi:predicted ATPase/tRNA A-37 threonylcarbamoyl transferase component Bud32/tetratricopeptide (TPR) repeat protein
MDRLNAALGERYIIERRLGEGGMATVYLTEDLKHERKVALKVLRPELAAVLGAERFQREITTTANLRHPHILPLYDSGEAGEFLFYVMPFVEGESLRGRLDRETQLPLDDALRIIDEVADALHYAHGQGVIHRDIKPENVLIEHDRAIVADFGIAQAVGASGGEKLTATGMSIGTPHYMSPEQASGEEVDARSDLYALGCLLYEMLAGSPPFTGPTPMAIIARHITDPVPALSTVRQTVPDAVTAALERALAKAPADRYATVEEWRKALTHSGAAAPTVQPASALRKQPPAPATVLLGREDQLAEGAQALHDGARVLTVTGVGGTGKTRFAIELFRRLHGDYADGAAFVSLASVTAPDEVMHTIELTLDIAEAHGRSALDAVVTVIGERRVLLLLDNLEQVIEAAGDIAKLVSRCPALHVIATSRSPLKIGAEVELALPPLALPEKEATEADELMRCPSVALFVQRAVKVKPSFALSAANAVSVAGICRQLDGLPLALELAAARVRILEPAALLQRLDHALDLLTSGDRDLPMRQRTLRATISWSYSLLAVPEQQLLRRLSVFHEGWSLEAMEQVCYAEHERFRALDELDSLVEKGLVRVEGEGERYTLLETIRAFAAEQLHAGGEVDAARDAHARYFVEFMRGVDRGIQGTGQVDAMHRGRAENANTLAALEWLIGRARDGNAEALEQGMLLCGYCGFYWHIVGLHLVGGESVDALLALSEGNAPSRGRALMLFTAGMVSANTGEMERTVAEWTRMAEDGRAVGDDAIAALAIAGIGYANLGLGRVADAGPLLDDALVRTEALGDAFLLSLTQSFKGMHLFLTGDLAGGVAMLESARTTQVRVGDFEVGGMALSFLAQMRFSQGDFVHALDLYREAEASFEVIGDKPEIARVRCEMGYTALTASDLDEAQRQFQRALRTYDEVGSPRGIGQALIGLAATEAAAGNAERAVTIAVAAQAMSERAGVIVEHPMASGMVERIAELRASIPQQQLEALVASGSALSPSEVLALCSS